MLDSNGFSIYASEKRAGTDLDSARFGIVDDFAGSARIIVSVTQQITNLWCNEIRRTGGKLIGEVVCKVSKVDRLVIDLQERCLQRVLPAGRFQVLHLLQNLLQGARDDAPLVVAERFFGPFGVLGLSWRLETLPIFDAGVRTDHGVRLAAACLAIRCGD
jgi:hypothetical protein